MTEQDVREKLENIRRGNELTVEGEVRDVSDVSDYTLGDFDWRNITTVAAREEEVLEIFPGREKVRIWLPVTTDEEVTPDMEEIVYGGETFKKNEGGIAKVVSQTDDGTEEYEVDYSVLEAPSGHKLSVELIEEDEGEEDETSVYYSDRVISISDIQ